MEFLESWAREHEVEMMLLEVYPDNSPAKEFYEGLGFKQYGLLERGSKFDAGEYKDEVLMYRWIG